MLAESVEMHPPPSPFSVPNRTDAPVCKNSISAQIRRPHGNRFTPVLTIVASRVPSKELD